MLQTKTISLSELPFKVDVELVGGKLYSVGGAVRDSILGKQSKDLDILITGVPFDKLDAILSKYGKVDSVGKSFGIIKFNTPQTGEIDIAIPRTERPNGQGGYQGFDVTSDHDLPIEKDLERRDFTINAIAVDVDGNFIDPFGGLADIKNKMIRMVNPQAFSDDPLRMLRAVQFASRFGFIIEPDTLSAIRFNADKITEISPERILIEFDKIVKKGSPIMGGKLLHMTGLFKRIFPIVKGVRFTLELMFGVETMGSFIFALAYGDELTEKVSEFYKNTLKGDLDTYNEIRALEVAATFRGQYKTVFDMYKIYPKILDSAYLSETLKQTIISMRENNIPFSLKDIPVDGNDLIALGFQGKEIGNAFTSILDAIYIGRLSNSRDEILDYLKGLK